MCLAEERDGLDEHRIGAHHHLVLLTRAPEIACDFALDSGRVVVPLDLEIGFGAADDACWQVITAEGKQVVAVADVELGVDFLTGAIAQLECLLVEEDTNCGPGQRPSTGFGLQAHVKRAVANAQQRLARALPCHIIELRHDSWRRPDRDLDRGPEWGRRIAQVGLWIPHVPPTPVEVGGSLDHIGVLEVTFGFRESEIDPGLTTVLTALEG